MIPNELKQLIANGEDSKVEFKDDQVTGENLARAMVAFLNSNGGRIFLGVEDNGNIKGMVITNKAMEEKVMNWAHNLIQPQFTPNWETVMMGNGKRVAIIELPSQAPDKPYKARVGKVWKIFTRKGSQIREASREEEARLYYASPIGHRYETKPIVGRNLKDLSMDRIETYFRKRGIPKHLPLQNNTKQWESLLMNTDYAVEFNRQVTPNVAGMLLFGRSPDKFIPQSGMRIAASPKVEKDYDYEGDDFRSALIPVQKEDGEIIDPGLFELALQFINRFVRRNRLNKKTGRRVEETDYPIAVIREVLANAIVHREYALAQREIQVHIYSDRMEVISPGGLPDGVTEEKIRNGVTAARNPTLRDAMSIFGYVDKIGMGIPTKIIKGMQEHNGTEPEIIPEEDLFTVRLFNRHSAR